MSLARKSKDVTDALTIRFFVPVNTKAMYVCRCRTAVAVAIRMGTKQTSFIKTTTPSPHQTRSNQIGRLTEKRLVRSEMNSVFPTNGLQSIVGRTTDNKLHIDVFLFSCVNHNLGYFRGLDVNCILRIFSEVKYIYIYIFVRTLSIGKLTCLRQAYQQLQTLFAKIILGETNRGKVFIRYRHFQLNITHLVKFHNVYTTTRFID